jgi:hypothetical protein
MVRLDKTGIVQLDPGFESTDGKSILDSDFFLLFKHRHLCSSPPNPNDCNIEKMECHLDFCSYTFIANRDTTNTVGEGQL